MPAYLARAELIGIVRWVSPLRAEPKSGTELLALDLEVVRPTYGRGEPQPRLARLAAKRAVAKRLHKYAQVGNRLYVEARLDPYGQNQPTDYKGTCALVVENFQFIGREPRPATSTADAGHATTPDHTATA